MDKTILDVPYSCVSGISLGGKKENKAKLYGCRELPKNSPNLVCVKKTDRMIQWGLIGGKQEHNRQ